MSWADLSPDLLRLISGSLPEVGDFVRFLSVCQAWRDTAPASLPQFLPWLLARGGVNSPSIARFRSVFSNTTWCAPGTYSRRTRWLASEDGTAAWSLTSEIGGPSPSLRLVDPFTGSTTTLPPFARQIHGSSIPYSHGFVLTDGTVVMYTFDDGYGCFAAAMLRPGDTSWVEGEAYDYQMAYAGFRESWTAAYHNGEIVILDLYEADTVKLQITCGGGNKGDVLDVIATTNTENDLPWCFSPGALQAQPRRIYTFKSRGELLVACLMLVLNTAEQDHPRALAGAMSVSVYALERAVTDGVDIPRWVERDARSLGDIVLFLGCPTSFAIDAPRFGGAISGGCAYFVLSPKNAGLSWMYVPEVRCVYRYSFEDGSATRIVLVNSLFGQEIRERLVQDPKKQGRAFCPRSIIRAPRTVFGPQFTIFVGNLPSWFGCSHLALFFAAFGEVADARIIWDRRSRSRSWGFGFVTMAIIDEPVDFFAAMDGKNLFGHVLRVKFTKERPEGPFVMPLLAPKQGSAAWKTYVRDFFRG